MQWTPRVITPGPRPMTGHRWQGQQLTSELCKKIGTVLTEAKMPPGTVMIKHDPLHGALRLVFQDPLTAPDATSLATERPPAGSVLAYVLSYFGSGNAIYANDDSSSEDTLENVFKQVTSPKSGPFGLTAVLAILPPLPDAKFGEAETDEEEEDVETMEDPEPESEEEEKSTSEPAASPDK